LIEDNKVPESLYSSAKITRDGIQWYNASSLGPSRSPRVAVHGADWSLRVANMRRIEQTDHPRIAGEADCRFNATTSTLKWFVNELVNSRTYQLSILASAPPTSRSRPGNEYVRSVRVRPLPPRNSGFLAYTTLVRSANVRKVQN